jgi:hypothetical protein
MTIDSIKHNCCLSLYLSINNYGYHVSSNDLLIDLNLKHETKLYVIVQLGIGRSFKNRFFQIFDQNRLRNELDGSFVF